MAINHVSICRKKQTKQIFLNKVLVTERVIIKQKRRRSFHDPFEIVFFFFF